MDRPVLHNILVGLILKNDIHTAKDLNKFLGTKKGKYIVSGKPDQIEAHEYINFISKFIYLGLQK